MGKRILSRRKGRGGSVFRATGWRRLGPAVYRQLDANERNSHIDGQVESIRHESGRGAPLAEINFIDGTSQLIVAPEGLVEGQRVRAGSSAEPNIGNVLPLRTIPEGSLVCNIEGTPNDGGKYVRASGGYAIVIAQTATSSIVQLPSGVSKTLSPLCRATIGVVAGAGRTEKPFLKAGARWHLSQARTWKYPTVRGKAMNPYSHPHGGGTHPKGSTPVSHNTPPGAKVGFISSRRTGRRKK